MRLTNRYVDRLMMAAESDVVVSEQFSKVAALIDPPTRLLHPTIVFRVVRNNQRGRREDRSFKESTAVPSGSPERA